MCEFCIHNTWNIAEKLRSSFQIWKNNVISIQLLNLNLSANDGKDRSVYGCTWLVWS